MESKSSLFALEPIQICLSSVPAVKAARDDVSAESFEVVARE